MDQDYLEKLSTKEKEWLSNFMREEMGGDFKHKGKKLNITKKDKRRCYGNNNSRNRCMYSLKKATGYLAGFDQKEVETNQRETANQIEDAIIEQIDSKTKNGKKS